MEPTMELRRYYEIVRKRIWIVAVITALAVGGVAAQLLIRPAEYQADVSMLVTPQSAALAAAQASAGVDAYQNGYRDAVLNDIIGLLHSSTLLQRVAERTGTTAAALGRPGRIEAKIVPNSDFIIVSARDRVPARAALIANTMTREFTNFYSEISRAEATSARVFIGDQLAAAKQRLARAETALAEFQLHTGSVALDTQATQMVQKALDLQAERDAAALDAQTAQARADAVRAALRSQNSRLAQVTVATNPVVSKLREELTADELQLASLRQTYTDQDPKVKEQLGRIASVQQQLRAEGAKVLSNNSLGVSPIQEQFVQNLVSAEVDATAARAKAAGFGQILDSMQNQLKGIPGRELAAGRLQRNARVEETLYTRLSSLYQDALIAEKKAAFSGQAAAVIVDPAAVPDTPVSSRLPFKAGLAGLLGVVVGAALALLVDGLDDRVHSPREAEGAWGVPVLASIPAMNRRTYRYLVGAPALAGSTAVLALLVVGAGLLTGLAGSVGLHLVVHAGAASARTASAAPALLNVLQALR